MKMVLDNTFKVLKIKKKTQAVFFSDLKAGDVFKLEYDLNGFYQGCPTVDILVNNKCVHYNNSLQLTKNLDNFELEKQL